MANGELKRVRAIWMFARKRVVNKKWVMANALLCDEGTLRLLLFFVFILNAYLELHVAKIIINALN